MLDVSGRTTKIPFLLLAVDGEGVKRLGKYGEADLKANDFIFAVSDGMGGAKAGDFASRIAIDKIARLMPQSFRSAASGIEIGFQDLLGELFDQIHAELTHLGFSYEELQGYGGDLESLLGAPRVALFRACG